MQFFLDTDTCIRFMKGHATTLTGVQNVSRDTLCISTITAFELHTEIEKCARPEQERAKVDLLLTNLSVMSFDSKSASIAASIRAALESQGQMIGPYDVRIAGQALAHSLTLVTGNVREFSRVPGLLVENWSS